MMAPGVFWDCGLWLAPLHLLQVLHHGHKALTPGPTPRASTWCHSLRSAWSLAPRPLCSHSPLDMEMGLRWTDISCDGPGRSLAGHYLVSPDLSLSAWAPLKVCT